MLIEHQGNVARDTRLHHESSESETDPQPWQFKQFNDAAALGIEFVWPYTSYIPFEDKLPKDVKIKALSDTLFSITLPTHLRVQEGHNLMLFPHHRLYLTGESDHKIPVPLLQVIEYDWWPQPLEVIFMRRPAIFEKGQPFAQAISIPRRDHTVKVMSRSTVEEIVNAKKFINEHQDEYITREVQANDDVAPQDNLYQRLSHMHQADELPSAIKPKKTYAPKLRWK